MNLKRMIAVLCVLALCLSLAGCGPLLRRLADYYGPKGLSDERKAEIDARIADYTERIVGPTWHNYEMNNALRFYEDGTVEDAGHISEPGNWYISFGEQYNRNADVSQMTQDHIEEYCDYYLRYDSPAYADGKKFNQKIRFGENGNLVLWDEEYVPGVDYLHEIPEDTFLDPYFYGNYPANDWGVWGFEYDGKIGTLWIFQPDGLGAETVGSMGGELIYPETFEWHVKDDMLYIEWPRSEEYIEENGKDIDAYHVERGDGEFWITFYLDHEGSSRQHLVETDQVDIYSW